MSDTTRTLEVGVHEVIIRLIRDDTGTALVVEAPRCGCGDAPPAKLTGQILSAIRAVVLANSDTVAEPDESDEPDEIDRAPGLAPTQPPGVA